MKGSSSAELPAINEVRNLVANPCANPNPKKKIKGKGKKVKEKKATKRTMAQHCFEKDILSKHQECSTSKHSKMGSKPTLGVYVPDEKNENLEQRKMAEMEAFFRGKRGNNMHFNPYRQQSCTSLQKRRLASAKARDQLLSLIPSKDTSRTYINEDLVVSAKQELDMIRRHTNHLLGREDTGRLGSLYEQSIRASKLREKVFGNRDRDKTNNSIESHDQVMDLDSRRPLFLAPISSSLNKTKSEEIKASISENFRDNESRNKEGKCLSAQIISESR